MTHLYRVTSSLGINVELIAGDEMDAEEKYLAQANFFPGYSNMKEAAAGRNIVENIKVTRLNKFFVLAQFWPTPFTCWASSQFDATDKFAEHLGFKNRSMMISTMRILHKGQKKPLGAGMIKVYAYPTDDSWYVDRMEEFALELEEGKST
jgi:hypothetical protein